MHLLLYKETGGLKIIPEPMKYRLCFLHRTLLWNLALIVLVTPHLSASQRIRIYIRSQGYEAIDT